jgi:hypothetical protein
MLLVNPDPIVTEVRDAVALAKGGDRAGARARLEALAARVTEDRQPFYECAVAHHLADAQDDIADELAWDIRALNAALRCADVEAERHGKAIAGSMSSLHANLAEDYFKLGDFTRSREHLAAARGFVSHLTDDAYGQMVRGGIERLAGQLDALRVEGLDGVWDGRLETEGGASRLIFRLKTGDHGTHAWLDMPDRNLMDRPAVSIARDGRQVTITMQTVAVTGELSEDGQLIEGRFLRGETALPLTLVRRGPEPAGAA